MYRFNVHEAISYKHGCRMIFFFPFIYFLRERRMKNKKKNEIKRQKASSFETCLLLFTQLSFGFVRESELYRINKWNFSFLLHSFFSLSIPKEPFYVIAWCSLEYSLYLIESKINIFSFRIYFLVSFFLSCSLFFIFNNFMSKQRIIYYTNFIPSYVHLHWVLFWLN